MLLLALFAHIVSAPLRHDEELFVSAGILFGQGRLYQDFGFNHLPNLPIILHWLALPFGPGGEYRMGRYFIFGTWLLAAAALTAIWWRATRSVALAVLGLLLLAVNPVLIGQTGTLVTNNFVPVAVSLAALAAYIAGVDRARPNVLLVALAGFLIAVAMGLKANYILLVLPFGLAALLAPAALPFADRLRRTVLPLLAGGIIGAIPTLIYLAADPAGLMAHVVGYHRGPHRAWAALSDQALVMSLPGKLVLAQSLWLGGSNLLLLVAIVAVIAALLRRGWRPGWPVLLAAGLAVAGAVVAFVPTPSFAQYYAPPLGFLLALLGLLVGDLTSAERHAAAPGFLAVALLALASDGARLAVDLPRLARPSNWTAQSVHRISAQVVTAANGRPIATLSPIYALDAGGQVYPELAAGPFVYRVADLFAPAERRHWRLMSATTLPAQLDADPPGAILVGEEARLDDALRAYARSRGYRQVPLEGTSRYGTLELYVPTSASMSLPAPMRVATSSPPSSAIR